MDADLVIRGGTVVDGTGARGVEADVAIAGDRIVAVEPDWPGQAHRVLDAAGRIVTPGFAPVEAGTEFLAEMMESVEDIPRQAILDGLPWDLSTYGQYLGCSTAPPKASTSAAWSVIARCGSP